jgi:hypothetical protein
MLSHTSRPIIKAHHLRASAFVIVIVMIVTLWLPSSVSAANPTINILVPSNTYQDNYLVPGRDFYVSGTIANIPQGAKMNVALYKKSGPDWNLYQKVEADHEVLTTEMYTGYSKLKYGPAGVAEGVIKKSLMPDLVYDPGIANSFNDAWRKCCFNNAAFSALFSGGEYTEDVTRKNRDNSNVPYFDAGDYKVVVTFMDTSGAVLATAEKTDIHFAVSEEKAMARFTPANHADKVKADASSKHYRVYWDPLAGIWYPYAYLPPFQGNVFYSEIVRKWRTVDRREYEGGRARFYIYNVTSGSATYNVELGAIANAQAINDSRRLAWQRYNVGEPSVATYSGVFTNFDRPGDTLDFTRIDLYQNPFSPNTLNMSELPTMKTITDINTPTKPPVIGAKYIALNGVVGPLQSSAGDIRYDQSAGWYLMNNRIKFVEWNIKSVGGGIVDSQKGEVLLKRIFSSTDSQISLFEFRCLINLNSLSPGTYTISAQGMDAYSNNVANATDSFKFIKS